MNSYNTNFSLELTSKVRKGGQKLTANHKLTIKGNFQKPSLFLLSKTTVGRHREHMDAAFRSQSDGGVSVDAVVSPSSLCAVCRGSISSEWMQCVSTHNLTLSPALQHDANHRKTSAQQKLSLNVKHNSMQH